MAKKMFTLRDFSGGINSTKDPRDIQINEFAYLKDFYLDQNGALRPSGSITAHAGLVSQKSLSSIMPCRIEGSAGYNLAYFETDHDTKTTVITNGNIDFFRGGETSTKGGSEHAAMEEPQNLDA